MMLFIDTGSMHEVEEIAAWGVLSGATTNPSLLADAEDPEATIRTICDLVDGPVSAEVVSDDPDEMVAQGRGLSAIHPNVVVKLPFGPAGLAATRQLAHDGIGVSMTLVFTAAQAVLAAEAGATYVSCFIGRHLHDSGERVPADDDTPAHGGRHQALPRGLGRRCAACALASRTRRDRGCGLKRQDG
jgi:transaldolase